MKRISAPLSSPLFLASSSSSPGWEELRLTRLRETRRYISILKSTVLLWTESYLTGWWHRKRVHTGVPQGLVLGGVLFLLYTTYLWSNYPLTMFFHTIAVLITSSSIYSDFPSAWRLNSWWSQPVLRFSTKFVSSSATPCSLQKFARNLSVMIDVLIYQQYCILCVPASNSMPPIFFKYINSILLSPIHSFY